MSEKKTKLQVESEKVEMLVNLTNKKIVELGVHTNYLTTVQRNFPIESTDHHRSFSSDVLV